MVKNFKDVMYWIRCWVEHDIDDMNECKEVIVRDKYDKDVNKSFVLRHENRMATVKSDQVIDFMNEFYEPIKHQESLLVQRTGVVLGLWDDTNVYTSW